MMAVHVIVQTRKELQGRNNIHKYSFVVIFLEENAPARRYENNYRRGILPVSRYKRNFLPILPT